MALRSALCLAVLLARLATVSASCYTPAGKEAPNYAACKSGSGDSFCCGNGWYCMSNGLCALDLQGSRLARGYCTDKTWKSDACPDFCLTQRTDYQSNAVELQRCSDNSFCCAQQSNCNCTTGDNTFKVPGAFSLLGQVTIFTQSGTSAASSTPTAVAASSTSSASIMSVTSSSTFSSSTVVLNTSSPSQTFAMPTISQSATATAVPGLSGGAKAGIGLGVVGAAIGFAALGFVLWRNKQQKKRIDNLTAEMQQVSALVKSPPQGGAGGGSSGAGSSTNLAARHKSGASVVDTALYPPSWHVPTPAQSPSLASPALASPSVVSPLAAGGYRPYRPDETSSIPPDSREGPYSPATLGVSPQTPLYHPKQEVHELA